MKRSHKNGLAKSGEDMREMDNHRLTWTNSDTGRHRQIRAHSDTGRHKQTRANTDRDRQSYSQRNPMRTL